LESCAKNSVLVFEHELISKSKFFVIVPAPDQLTPVEPTETRTVSVSEKLPFVSFTRNVSTPDEFGAVPKTLSPATVTHAGCFKY
jgi:hypothetical protein